MANAGASVFGVGGKAIADTMGKKGGVQTIQDPLAGYKQWAANQDQSQFGIVQPATQPLMDYFSKNFGQTDFSGQMPQLSQDVTKAVQGDVEGTGGPFTSLKNNLLGAFDTGAQKFTLDPLKNQQIKEGIYSSGPGMSQMSDAGTSLAQQRGVLGSQVDTQLLDIANRLGQQQFQNNQLLGFTDPLQALTQAQSILPTNVQDINNLAYQQPNTGASLLGQILPMVASAALAGPTGGASLALPGLMSAMGGTQSVFGSGQPLAGYNSIPGYQQSPGLARQTY